MFSVETVSALERRINASIPQQSIRSELNARLKNIGRSAKIAGFRPGKVPPKVIEQFYGAKTHEEILGEALQRSFDEAVQSNNLKVAGMPRFEIKTKDLQADQVEYSAVFEVYPEVVIGDVSGEEVERVVFELSQEDIDNTIATLRKQRATFEEATRAAQNEDKVVIDFVGKLEGEIFQGGEAKDYPVTLGSGSMLAAFEAAIVGMKAGEEKTFDMTFPEDYHGKNVAGKQVTFTITVQSVSAPKLPEVDAEFVKSVGIEDGDVSKLHDEVRGNLAREVARRLKVRNKDAAMDVLLKVAGFEVPKSLVDWEVQNLIELTAQDMESRGMKMKGVTLPPEMFTERAAKRVKLGLVLGELVRQHDLKAAAEQVRALVEDYAQSFDQPDEVVRWYYNNPERLQEVENLVLEENVVKWVMDQAKTTDKAIVFSELMGN